MYGTTTMKKKSIPWFFPQFDQAEKNEVLKVLDSQYINDGHVARELEQKIADFLGCRHCLSVTSGTAALTLSLMALGIGPGDEVIVPDFTFIATANAVRLAGADVKLVDIEPTRFTLDPEKTRSAIGPHTKAIVSVDVNGRGADYSALELLCKEYNLALVCDSAEALGSKYKGQYLGTFGDAGCFSFSANKTISSGQGGMIATNNTDLFHRMKELKDQGRRFTGTGGNDLHPVMGYNFKYTNLQAAVALAQFEKMAARLKHFQERDQWYLSQIHQSPGITLPPLEIDSGEVRQWTDLLCENRQELEKRLNEEGVEVRPFWYPLHQQKPYALPDDGFENAIKISKKGLWLPSSFQLTHDDVIVVSSIINQVMSTKLCCGGA